ncbi:MAG: hypothetical protein R3C03_17600 [Pirellulaceae bacterium]
MLFLSDILSLRIRVLIDGRQKFDDVRSKPKLEMLLGKGVGNDTNQVHADSVLFFVLDIRGKSGPRPKSESD